MTVPSLCIERVHRLCYTAVALQNMLLTPSTEFDTFNLNSIPSGLEIPSADYSSFAL